jgi:hypothetical protein
MDDTEYRKKLSEVADWAIPKLCITDIKESEKRQRGRGRPSNEELYQEAHEQIFLDIHNGVNPTAPPEIIRLKNQATVCDDCGCDCPQGRKKEKKLYQTGSKKLRNWRERCVTCNKNKNPFTGKFDLSPQEAPHIWTTFLREVKGIYKTAGNEARNNLNKEEPDK